MKLNAKHNDARLDSGLLMARGANANVNDVSGVSSRRAFLKATTLVGGGMAIGFVLPSMAARFTGSEAHAKPGVASMDQWIQILPDNSVRILVDKSEMGQGVATSMPMLIAEELDIDWQKISYAYAPAAPQYINPAFGVQATGGSTSVRAMYLPLRQAGAAAKQMLVAAAAQEWSVAPDTITAAAGMLSGPGGKSATYGDMATIASRIAPPAPDKLKLKDPAQFKVIGTPVKRLDTPGKTDGSAQFGIDIELPDMLTAVVARSPVIGGTVASVDDAACLQVKGVKQVVRVKTPTSEGVAVLANSYWAAKMGRDALKVTWESGAKASMSTDSLHKEMSAAADSGKGAIVARADGKISDAGIVRAVRAEYELPYLAHAPMEPMNITAAVTTDGVHIYGGTQLQGPTQFIVAQAMKIKPEQVQVTTTHLGGGFGRRLCPDALLEAVQASAAAKVPVKVVFSREDDTRGQYYRPAALIRVSGGIDKENKPVTMHARAVCSSVTKGSGFDAALIKENGLDIMATEGIDNWPYDCPNQLVEWIPYEPGVRTWFWRSVGNSQNAFAAESFIDELAWVAGIDPFEYRRGLLANKPRHLRALELAADKAGWGKPLPAGRARGIAVAESFGSVVAQVAEVSVVDNKPKVHRVVIGADVGTVVNPDTVNAQLEGAMIYGLSAALSSKITFKDGQVVESNFHDYTVLRHHEAPQVEAHWIVTNDHPGGVGEPGLPPIAPAVANALYALTGKRLRKLPLDLSQV